MSRKRPGCMKVLECKLTKEEKIDYGHELGSIMTEIEDLDRQKKELSDQQKPLKQKLKRLGKALDTGVEERDVECEWIYNWEKGTKQAKRLDNKQFAGGMVPIEAHERQEELDDV